MVSMHAQKQTAMRLGDILVERGNISRAALEGFAAHARGRLGQYLRAHGVICGRNLSQALAEQQNLAYRSLTTQPADARLFRPGDLPLYQRARFIPYARSETGITIATPEPSAELRATAEQHYGCYVQMVVISPRDFTAYFTSTAALANTRRAQLSLRRQYRGLVADRIMLPHQALGLVLLCGLFCLSFMLAPVTSWQVLLVVCNLFYLTTFAIKLQFYGQGMAALRAQNKTEPALVKAVAALDNATLPTYSILVPMFRETSAVMARLIANLNALDYPREKLDIKLICEADDAATLDALRALHPPETMEIIAVPPSLPRTKPKACNIALPQLRGEFAVIYDAEDSPAPDQLKRAVAMFRACGERLACLQGALNYYNRDENLLTQLFSIEYSALFRIQLPALERMHLPIPLGGTSNHLRISALRAVGGWDAFNVTEDADLGIRLRYLGYETRMLPSTTLEEAPISLGA